MLLKSDSLGLYSGSITYQQYGLAAILNLSAILKPHLQNENDDDDHTPTLYNCFKD